MEGYARAARNQPLAPEQQLAHSLLQPSFAGRFFVSRELINLLRFYVPPRVVQQIEPLLQVLIPLKYQRRWARRLHQDFGFSREDAHLLSLATFGTDLSGSILGVDLFVTFDLRLIDRFTAEFTALERRFVRMVSHLTSPYTAAVLPEVVTPAEVLHLP